MTREPESRPAAETPALELFYAPRSVAVVGAHDTRGGLSQFTNGALQLCRRTGGVFYPVNPKLAAVYGVPCIASVAELPESVDVLCIFTGNAIGILEEAAAAGRTARFVMVFANGFSELQTADGVAKEERLLAAVRAVGGRLIGPNTNLNAWDPRMELPGRKIAVVAQSGSQGRPVVEAQSVGVGISYWAPTGNEADLESADFIEFFVADPATAVVCGYIEGFTSGQRLREAAASAIEHRTPLAVVKVGRSSAGAVMARSHTGHLAGSDEVYDAFFEQYGVIRVDDIDELTEVGVALARCPVPAADGVAVMSASGGTAAHVADLTADAGLPIPTLLPETRAALREFIPAEFRIDNPVDNGGPSMFTGAGPRMWEIVLGDPQIGVLLCPVPASTPRLTRAVVDAILTVAPTATKPILPIWLGPYDRSDGYDDLWAAGLPVFRNVRGAVLAARALLGHPSRNAAVQETAKLARALPPIPREVVAGETLQESAATRWLQARGFTFAENADASTADEAVQAAERIGYPVVVKGTGVAHKSEAGLVATRLVGPEQVRAAAEGMLARGAHGLLVARHETGGVELLVGLSTDPVLGPVVVVGAGGVTAEAVRDVARSVLPLTADRVETMLSRLRIAPLLDGWRGGAPVDREALIDTVLALGALAESGEVVELDINPLLVRPDGVVGLDALVRLAAAGAGRG
ncbi:MAG: pimeloyl-CoA synthetase [Pseudonocardia sp.]|nr:pimeloyl-CoA synthetase [Pseudonocardia sp.]